MDQARALDVLIICVPVFAVMGLGKLLERRGYLNDGRCGFINWLVYYFSLPALIFNAAARQTFSSFFDPVLVLMPLLGLVSITTVSMLIARIAGLKRDLAAVFCFGTFWANATYVGFPLCINAFGNTGEVKAAIYNAFVLPFFILFGYMLIGFYGAGEGDAKFGPRIRKAFLNPILLSAVVAVIVALIADQFRDESGVLLLPASVISLATLIGAFLKMIGSMGLPLALLAIGASLKWEQSKKHLGILSWTVGCKLVLLPLVTLLLIQAVFTESEPVSTGCAIILAATPSAVACYVISCQLGIEKGLVATMLVVSTALSTITIPIWIYIVKGF
jgi:predicted permease